MKTYHILNGDCLAHQLSQTSITKNLIICRECLVEGKVEALDLSEFWEIRENHISEAFGAKDYKEKVVRELEQISALPNNTEINLWFENDLFCQVNMWFILSLLAEQTNISIFRVFPIIENPIDTWKGFGIATPETLEKAYKAKVQFHRQDIELGINLWIAYQKNDFVKLTALSKQSSECFQYLEKVCQAHIDRFPQDDSMGRPEKTIQKILKTQSKNFQEVFTEFSSIEGIYGFGDLQVMKIFNQLINK